MFKVFLSDAFGDELMSVLPAKLPLDTPAGIPLHRCVIRMNLGSRAISFS